MAAKAKTKKFRVNDHVVYPAHGVGKITAVEKQDVGGTELELYVIMIADDNLTLRVPVEKAPNIGVRNLSNAAKIEEALNVLTGKARVKRSMWSRRAQEYEQKINSGDIIQIAEVVRDLHRGDEQREQSYSERQLYETAVDRLTREVTVVEKSKRDAAYQKIIDLLTSRGS